MGKLRQVASVREEGEEGLNSEWKKVKVKTGAERPPGVPRQRGELSLEPRSSPGPPGGPSGLGCCKWVSSLLMAPVTTGQHPSLSQSFSMELPRPALRPMSQARLDPGSQRSRPRSQRTGLVLTSRPAVCREPEHACLCCPREACAPAL